MARFGISGVAGVIVAVVIVVDIVAVVVAVIVGVVIVDYITDVAVAATAVDVSVVIEFIRASIAQIIFPPRAIFFPFSEELRKIEIKQEEQRRREADHLHEVLAQMLLEKVADMKRSCADQIIEAQEAVAHRLNEEKGTLEALKREIEERVGEERQQLLGEAREVAARADEVELRLRERLEQLTRMLRAEAGAIEERIKSRLREVRDVSAEERSTAIDELRSNLTRRIDVRRRCLSESLFSRKKKYSNFLFHELKR